MKKTLILLYLFVAALSIKAQETPQEKSLAQAVAKGTAYLLQAQGTQNVNTLRESIPFFEMYMEALRDPQSRQTAENAADAWDIMMKLANAYLITANESIKDLTAFAQTYYKTDAATHFVKYYRVMEAMYNYHLSHQQPDSITSLARHLLEEASTHAGQTLYPSACHTMLAAAAYLRHDLNDMLNMLEQAHASGKEVEQRNRHERPIYDTYVKAMTQLIMGYYTSGQFQRALSLAEELESGTAEAFGRKSEEHLRLLCMKHELLMRLGEVRRLAGLTEEIDTLYQEADLSPEVRNMIQSGLANYRNTLKGQGNGVPSTPVKATPQTGTPRQHEPEEINAPDVEELERNLKILEDNPGPFDVARYEQAVSYYTLALLQHYQYKQAHELVDRARKHIMKHYGFGNEAATRNIDVMEAYIHLATFNNSQAIECLVKAKGKYEKLGDLGFAYLTCMAKLSEALARQGQTGYAKLVLDKASRLLESKKGDYQTENTAFEASVAEFGSIYMMLGYGHQAKPFLQRVLDSYGKDHKELNRIRIQMARLHLDDSEWKQAADLLNITLHQSPSETDRTEALALITAAKAKLTSEETALYLKTFISSQRQKLNDLLPSLPAMERENMWSVTSGFMTSITNIALAAMPHDSAIARQAYDNALFGKSMQNLGPHEPPQWRQVRDALTKGEAAIEFLRVPMTSSSAFSPHYGALVITKDSPAPAYVDLCPMDDIDEKIIHMKHTDQELINALYGADNTELYSLIWQKLEPSLKGMQRIYYSPVGSISRLNIEIVSNGQQQINKRFELHRVTTTAEIARTKTHKWGKQGSAVIYGGITYHESMDDMQAAAAKVKRANEAPAKQPSLEFAEARKQMLHAIGQDEAQRSLAAILPDRGADNMLAGTLIEAQCIDSILINKGFEVDLRTGDLANEESLKALSGKAPAILHLATHGFVISTSLDFEQHRNVVEAMGASASFRQSALLFCGLLMAGSALAWRGATIPDGIDDGILTAHEISEIDLTGCRLVVLSACETGLGLTDTQNADEFGIVRALKMAHAETVVATLWEVPDMATTMLMKTFYSDIASGANPRKALKHAQEKMRKHHSEPYFWAGFTIID